uniref:Histone-lysine N-methyltransferase, H3 lysine-79 specific n=1 Tax=Melanopsichium pennsylvanicum 4 TaxID=1398559 RepID=A0A077R9E5_9BASI|nr:related to protein-lysine N-methyltransferase [Melanopsichium pennsylvanicum 4]
MINFFGGKASSAKPSSATTSTSASTSHGSRTSSTSSTTAQHPLKKTKLTSPTVTVVTTVKKKLTAPKPTQPRDAIAALSGYNSKNALPEEKRRRIIEERLAAQRQKSIETSLEAQLRAPVKSSSSSSTTSSSFKSKSTSVSKRTSTAASISKPKPKKSKKKIVDSDSDDLNQDDELGGWGTTSRKASTAPSTPRGSKRASVDPYPITDSYQKVGRDGVLPNYTVPRDVLASTSSSSQDTAAQQSKPISSADIVSSNFKLYGPYFHGLGDAPRAVVEYPGLGASEEFLLLVPKDTDEYDPLMELLATVRAIVTHFLTQEQRKAFGQLDSLEVSNNAGMILPSATNGGSASTTSVSATATATALIESDRVNGTRAKSADLFDSQASKASRRDELVGGLVSKTQHLSGSKTPDSHDDRVTSHTAPVSPSSHLAPSSSSTATVGGNVAKSVLVNNAVHLLRLDSPAPTESSLTSDHSSTTTTTNSDPDSILRSFTKARNRRDGPLFMRTLSRFNLALANLRDTGALASNINTLGITCGVPEGIWRLIQDQVYARVVGPRVEELGRYQAFSDNVYGELLPRFMSEIAQLTKLGPGKVFVDLGSGVGNLLIQTSLQTGAEAYGCEMMPIPSTLASQQITEAQLRWSAWGLRGGAEVEAWLGDFGEHNGVREVLKRADVVLVNNYAFLPKTNENLSLLFLDLKDGAQIANAGGAGVGKRGRGRGRGRDVSQDGRVRVGGGSDLMVGQDVRRKRWKAAIDDDDEDQDDEQVV